MWVSIAATAFVVALPVVPLLWGYHVRQSAYGFSRPYEELVAMSARLTGVAGISQRAVFWKGLLPNTFYEGALFPGLTISLLAMLAVLASWARPRFDASVESGTALEDGSASTTRGIALFYFAAAVVMWSLTLGPQPSWSGTGSIVYGPYWLLLHLPGVESIRVPSRAWLVATLCLAVCAGVGASWLAGRARRSWVVLPIAVAIVTEVWFRAGTYAVPTPMAGGLVPAGAVVLDLPLFPGYENTGPQYLAVLGGYRVVNGYSGYAAPHSDALRHALADHRPAGLNAFRRVGDLYVLVRPEVDRPFVDWLETQDGIESLPSETAVRAYRLPRVGPGPAIAPPLPLPRRGETFIRIP
jgi:hypothetical protein